MIIHKIITLILGILTLIVIAYYIIRDCKGRYINYKFAYSIILLLITAMIFNTNHSNNKYKQENTQEIQMFKLEKPNKKSINSFQQEFLQNMMDVEIKNAKSNRILLVPLNNKGYIDLGVQTDQLKELEKDDYFKKNKEKFKQSLKDNPIKAETLIKTLKNDLTDDFTITQRTIRETTDIKNQWIVISFD